MRPSLRNHIWVSQIAGTIPGGGGGGGGLVPVVWTPDGGVHTVGMEISAAWDAAPPGTDLVRVIQFYSNNGGASYIETGDAYEHPSGVSPFEFNTVLAPEISPGDLIRFSILFRAGTTVVGIGNASLDFTAA